MIATASVAGPFPVEVVDDVEQQVSAAVVELLVYYIKPIDQAPLVGVGTAEDSSFSRTICFFGSIRKLSSGSE